MESIIDNEFGVEFNKLYKLEVIVSGEHEALVATIMQDASAKGFTLLRNVSGMGHHGFHEGRLLYNDQHNQVMFITVAARDSILAISKTLKTLFEKHSGVMFVSPVLVSRQEYFTP
ncbi:MAG: DUF190 domain-containing protein [Candidatus Caenarcaniphilales bacterium]|jgi:PII-like signaling protein|nr:DUF190 domain-containing protein [Candidatus Caenarcaniphilales bacterium]